MYEGGNHNVVTIFFVIVGSNHDMLCDLLVF